MTAGADGATPAPILLLGGSGLLGTDLRVALAPLGAVVAPPRAELDLSDLDRLRDALRSLRPAAIVNAAAFSLVDEAEAERERAWQLNAAVPRVLAEEAARAGVPLVHYSTDYVFDGTARRPYAESDQPNPLNAYGETKLAGENAVRDVAGRHLILRISWLYGSGDRGFVGMVKRLARERGEIRMVRDQRGSPTWIRLVSAATARILRGWREGPAFVPPSEQLGTFHLVAAGDASRYELAAAILDLDDPRQHRHSGLVPITTAERAAVARRPAYSVLATDRARAAFGIPLREWKDDLREAMAGAKGDEL